MGGVAAKWLRVLGLLSLCSLIFSVLFGLAALLALSNTERAEPRVTQQHQPFAELLLALAAGMLMLILVIQAIDSEVSDSVAYGVVIVSTLLLIRLSLTLRDNRVLLEEAEKRSVTDGLTGLWNHTYFQYRLREEILRAQREYRKVGLLMLDIDSFKLINDFIGHQGGDRILRDLGSKLRSTVRATDVACRVGGDEFAIIVPDATERELDELGQRIVTSAHDLTIDLPSDAYEQANISVSVGVCLFPDCAESGSDLIEHADVALYHAKENGRDRVVRYEKASAPV